jgi:hypothetical protein
MASRYSIDNGLCDVVQMSVYSKEYTFLVLLAYAVTKAATLNVSQHTVIIIVVTGQWRQTRFARGKVHIHYIRHSS